MKTLHTVVLARLDADRSHVEALAMDTIRSERVVVANGWAVEVPILERVETQGECGGIELSEATAAFHFRSEFCDA
ncbi:hypothetical protein ACIP5T_03145 [Microbacterium sp. NPDC088619]|uniref:hypothetical protein n=1 Tax=Microbacterium sp. NPDC088619 TaxID=3364196 RepID=UPI003823B9BB